MARSTALLAVTSRRRFAPRRPMPHALTLGVLGIVVSTIGAVLTWNKGSTFGPRWYPVALIVVATRCFWAGLQGVQ